LRAEISWPWFTCVFVGCACAAPTPATARTPTAETNAKYFLKGTFDLLLNRKTVCP
jgi:hypothetical protein